MHAQVSKREVECYAEWEYICPNLRTLFIGVAGCTKMHLVHFE